MIASGAIGVFRKMWDYTSHFYEVNAWLPKKRRGRESGRLEEARRRDPESRARRSREGRKKAIWAAMIPTNENYKKIMTKNGMKVLTPVGRVESRLEDWSARRWETNGPRPPAQRASVSFGAYRQ